MSCASIPLQEVVEVPYPFVLFVEDATTWQGVAFPEGDDPRTVEVPDVLGSELGVMHLEVVTNQRLVIRAKGYGAAEVTFTAPEMGHATLRLYPVVATD